MRLAARRLRLRTGLQLTGGPLRLAVSLNGGYDYDETDETEAALHFSYYLPTALHPTHGPAAGGCTRRRF